MDYFKPVQGSVQAARGAKPRNWIKNVGKTR